MLTDALGRPSRFVVTAGQVDDCTRADRLLEGVEAGRVIAGKGYDSERGCCFERSRVLARSPSSRRSPTERRKQGMTASSMQRSHDPIERTFDKLERFGRIAARYGRKVL